MFDKLKKTAQKADETLDQVKKDLNETAIKTQEVLDDSSKSVQTIVKVVTIALAVSIITNIVTIGLNIAGHRKSQSPNITIENLYLGDFTKYDK